MEGAAGPTGPCGENCRAPAKPHQCMAHKCRLSHDWYKSGTMSFFSPSRHSPAHRRRPTPFLEGGESLPPIAWLASWPRRSWIFQPTSQFPAPHAPVLSVHSCAPHIWLNSLSLPSRPGGRVLLHIIAQGLSLGPAEGLLGTRSRGAHP